MAVLSEGRRSIRNCQPKAEQAKRVAAARAKLKAIFSDTNNEHYFRGDAELRVLLDLSEPVIRKERRKLGVPPRDDRIFSYLKPLSPETMFLDEMVLRCGGRVDYHCLYHIMNKRGVNYPRRGK